MRRKDPLTAIRRYICRRKFPVLWQDSSSITFTAGMMLTVFPSQTGVYIMRTAYHCGYITEEKALQLYKLCNRYNDFFRKKRVHFHWEQTDDYFRVVYIDIPLTEEILSKQGRFSECIVILGMALNGVYNGMKTPTCHTNTV